MLARAFRRAAVDDSDCQELRPVVSSRMAEAGTPRSVRYFVEAAASV